MIVLDASAVVELLRNERFAESLRSELANGAGQLIVPHLLDVEVASALRRLAVVARIDSSHAERLLAQLLEIPAERVPHTTLLPR